MNEYAINSLKVSLIGCLHNAHYDYSTAYINTDSKEVVVNYIETIYNKEIMRLN